MQSSSDTTTLSASSIHPDHAIVLNDSVPDDILVQWMQAGSKPAFDLIYRRYWKALYHLAFNLFRDRIVCEDIVQDVFFQLWDKGGSLQIQTLRSYLFAATRHGESDSDVLEKDLAHQASMAISMLPEKCREIFVLSRKHAMPVAQIAQHLELSPKTVENQITIALKKLRSSLSDYFVVMIITSFLQA
ncbi:hypothetical protein DSL64_04200 [Dyadobacter luteus]|uniref:RNA polymerase sigma-70 factor n=1 Tax=Dyadobacter luteus TaxID=2259619 RepID=A0A3D8YG11_9BACT|nr:sigma factor-like helix-turn-helix DNA-binding protein [Dyadobacter luteus]REA63648.1 hypothetical protein DSL64_04200 [Dyadobacter luteus]